MEELPPGRACTAGRRPAPSLARRGRPRSSACGTRAMPARRTRRGPSARIAPGRCDGAAPHSRAGVSAVQHPSPGSRGTAGAPDRVHGMSAGRPSLAAPGQPISTALSLRAKAQASRSIEYPSGTGFPRPSAGHPGTRPAPPQPDLSNVRCHERFPKTAKTRHLSTRPTTECQRRLLTRGQPQTQHDRLARDTSVVEVSRRSPRGIPR
jgi:hypothetical protein